MVIMGRGMCGVLQIIFKMVCIQMLTHWWENTVCNRLPDWNKFYDQNGGDGRKLKWVCVVGEMFGDFLNSRCTWRKMSLKLLEFFEISIVWWKSLKRWNCKKKLMKISRFLQKCKLLVEIFSEMTLSTIDIYF